MKLSRKKIVGWVCSEQNAPVAGRYEAAENVHDASELDTSFTADYVEASSPYGYSPRNLP
jgi:hypothetical protein